MKRTYYILLLALFAIALLWGFITPQNQEDSNEVFKGKAWITNAQSTYVAGNEIKLNFTTADLNTSNASLSSGTMFLYTSHSYGSTVISSESFDNPMFIIPKNFTNKSGQVQWKLFQASRVMDQGSFLIAPDTLSKPVIECYVGPPSVIAGGMDYSMVVVLATDSLDNLLPDGIPVHFKEQNKNENTRTRTEISDRFAWKKIFPSEVTGRIALSAAVKNETSNEMNLDVRPNNATDFELTIDRVHPFADGNQIAVYKTSQIKDRFGNVVSDGTLVRFEIESSTRLNWQTSATTINGFAFGNILHPDRASVWQVKAYVDGAAESNVLQTEYESILDDFDVLFSENNRTVTVGPLKSYMSQLIPDGASVILQIDSISEAISKTTRNGKVQFQLPADFYAEGIRNITIQALGISRNFKIELK